MNGGVTIVLATLGSIGDLLPFLAVGKAFRRRGHDVVVVTSEGCQGMVRMHGLDFCGVPDRFRAQDPFRDVATSPASGTWGRVWREFFVPATRPTYEAMERLVESRRCVVVASWSAMGARLACEASGIPYCDVYLSPYAVGCGGPDGESHETFVAAALEGVRHELGLSAPGRHASGERGPEDASIGFFPDWFCRARPTVLNGVTPAGFPLHDDALVPASRSELRRFLDGGDAPLVFTPGSFMDQAGAFFEDAVDACQALGKRAIFLTPHRRQVPSTLPETVLHLDYVPLHRVLGRAAALFHHGGIGTCAQAMRAGVPQIIAPLFFDQFDNAARVEALGLGFGVNRGALGATTMAEAISRALTLQAEGSPCLAVRQRFQEQDAAEAICDQVCRLVSRC